MADSTEDNYHVLSLSFLATVIIALIPGLLIHSFIIGINLYEWSKGRSITPVDHIVSVLGISRMGIQCCTLPAIVASSVRSLDSNVNPDIVNASYLFFNYTNIWMTTLLLIVFCLKISTLSTRPFLYLKSVILPRTVYFIVAIGLLSAVKSLLPLWTDMTISRTYNTTMGNQILSCTFIFSMLNFTLASSIPLLFYYISSVLLFTSLYHHTGKMKMSSNLSINLEPYYSAMKLVFFTFIYNTIYFIGHFICALIYYFHCLTFTWLYIFLDFLPGLHTFYLIYRTASLRSQMSKVLQNVTEFLFQRKPETRENIDCVTTL